MAVRRFKRAFWDQERCYLLTVDGRGLPVQVTYRNRADLRRWQREQSALRRRLRREDRGMPSWYGNFCLGCNHPHAPRRSQHPRGSRPVSRGTFPIICCDHEDGCTEWTLDWYEALCDNWRSLMAAGWQYDDDPYARDKPHLCPEHAASQVPA